jgi:hypothetical protein
MEGSAVKADGAQDLFGDDHNQSMEDKPAGKSSTYNEVKKKRQQ